jgi:hypothetical protein
VGAVFEGLALPTIAVKVDANVVQDRSCSLRVI